MAARKQSAFSRWLKPIIAIAAVLLASVLLYRTLSRFSWDDIAASMMAIPGRRIALASVCAAGSYLCLTGFDWLALRYVGQRLPYKYVALTSFVSLSVGHNIGFAALSSGAIRYRFYSRWGVGIGDIAKIIVFCGVTVGLGLAVLGGCAFLLRPNLAAQITGVSEGTAMAIGISCVAVAIGYMALAATVRRPLRIRTWAVELPPLRLALGQIVVGPINFALVAGCLYHALAGIGEVSYPAVAAIYVIAIVTSLLAHAPGGLGVIETVVLYLLPHGQFIGALIAFRVIYFFAPLCIGAPMFGIAELAFRRRQPLAQTA
jgi:glycosyltransferase 2 family protein